MIVVIGHKGHANTQELLRAYWGRPVPNAMVVQLEPGEALPSGHPAAGRGMQGGHPTADICQAGSAPKAIINAATNWPGGADLAGAIGASSSRQAQQQHTARELRHDQSHPFRENRRQRCAAICGL